MPAKKLKNISEIRRHFHTNDAPIYFVSATNFNLLGLDEWVKNFKFISYIDCYDGRHPNTLVPSDKEHGEFQSIEDINNFMLQHKHVVDHVAGRGGKPKFAFLMFDQETEKLAKELGAEVWFPKAKLRSRMDNKIETVRACSQAIWPGESPMLVRNYDYSPHVFDSLILLTQWQGRTVLGTSDCLLGLVDGINDLGLSVSLTFGGRHAAGDGFGVPLLLRYVLQICETSEEASKTLARISTHMSYNVTLLDAKGQYKTVQLAPDRPAVITSAAVATNHQTGFQWDQETRFTATVERERYLLQRLTLRSDTEQAFKEAFLRAPLYSTAYAKGFGTLYTAAYKPCECSMQMLWPGASWNHSIESFQNSSIQIKVPDVMHF